MTKTCFVIMPIGTQSIDGREIDAGEFRQRYDDLIKEALLAANPALDITRADDVALSGTITTDILTRIMRSDLVVADVSYPNPNVLYELGLRHPCRPGTIIIRDSNASRPPFDISHLRHFEYQNTPSGLKSLAEKFRQYFQQHTLQPERPDSHFLEIAKLTEYRYPDYSSKSTHATPPEVEMIMALMSSPEFLSVLSDVPAGQAIDPARLLSALAANPEAAKQVIGAMVKGGHIAFNQNRQEKALPSSRPKRKRKG